MKPLSRTAKGHKAARKFDVQNHPAKQWGMHSSLEGPRKVHRSDGSVSADKTAGLHSRPGKKAQLRQANRAITKSARQALKRQMQKDADQ